MVLKAIFDRSPYSKAQGGNVEVRSGWDISEDIPSPSIILTYLTETPAPTPATADMDRVDEAVQIDCYAASEAEVNQLKYEVTRLTLEQRTSPGAALVPNNLFALLLPGQWINNDALNQAENLRRRTETVTLYRHRNVT